MFRFMLPFLFPFIVAYLLARIVKPVAIFLRKRFHLPLILGSTIAIVFLFALIGSIVYFLGRALFGQLISFIQDIPIYQNVIYAKLAKICCCMDKMLGYSAGSVQTVVWDNINQGFMVVQENLMPFITTQTMTVVTKVLEIGTFVLIVAISVINLVPDFDSISERYRKTVIYQVIHPITGKLASVGYAYVKTQSIIMSVNAVILFAGFLIIKNKYALLAAIGIAFMDAFPIIGSGLFLIPWAIISLLSKKVFVAAMLISLYGLCELVRQLLEPRLLGNRLGIKPIFSIMAMYVGVDLFGVVGFLLGPLALVILRTIVSECV
ncbi:predicted permease [Lachnospiraceae bacterium KM106-2]|nr:predicted permease [Lachnospiraceae bacterium KM106-2]